MRSGILMNLYKVGGRVRHFFPFHSRVCGSVTNLLLTSRSYLELALLIAL